MSPSVLDHPVRVLEVERQGRRYFVALNTAALAGRQRALVFNADTGLPVYILPKGDWEPIDEAVRAAREEVA